MRNARLIWRFFLPCAALLLLTAGAMGWLAARRTEALRAEDALRVLRSEALLLAELSRSALAGEPGEGLQERVRALGASTHSRLTVIRADGRVLADSDAADLAAVGPHGVEREELRRALAERFGVARRTSDTTHVETDYVAVSVPGVARPGSAPAAPLGWARAARPVADARADAAEIRSIVLGTAGAALGVGLLAAYVLARRLARPLRQLTAAASAMAAGDLTERVRVQGGRELAELAQAYNRMADELAARMGDLAAEKAELKAVLAGMVEGVIAVDAQERIVLINAAGARILGLDAAQVPGRPLWEVVRLREVAETLASALRDGASQSSEIRRPARPHDRVLRLHASPLASTGSGAGGAVLVLHDITELRQLEAVRRDFVANASHELKTPLAAVRGLVESILDDEHMEPATQRRFLASIRAQSERLGDLVEEMLALSRLEAQGTEIPLEPLDLREAVADALDPLRHMARERDVDLHLEQPQAPLRVMGAREPLRRVVANLVDNALKHTPRGGSVRVRLATEGTHAVLEVSDTGPGIPGAERERVFERFYRLDKGRSRDAGGTGLGLAIVKHLLLALGGSVRIADAPGGGALLRVELRLAGD